MTIQDVANLTDSLTAKLDGVIAGKSVATRKAVTVLLCQGHLLIEDVPGVGKTTLAKALARLIGGTFSRIQFTSDLMPSDVSGASIYNQKEQIFEFLPGPIFANVMLADEVNRATPKTQSALLEAMEERTVTVDGVQRGLPDPFLVIATQNNIEMAGTFPLPEAQMDRFFGRITLGYPDRDAEQRMLEDQQVNRADEALVPIATLEELRAAQLLIRQVRVDSTVRQYMVDITRASREHPLVSLGASPRATLHLQHGAQAIAAGLLRDFVTPDDVKVVAELVLSHRIVPRSEARLRGQAGTEIIQSIIQSVPTPVPV
jgi:MoxR-like ATPase